MFAFKRFDKETYKRFKSFKDGNRVRNQEDLYNSYSSYETNMTFLGITAVEDRL